MITRLIGYSVFIALNLFLALPVFAQKDSSITNDYRIEKFKKDIVQYLVKQEVFDKNLAFKMEDFKLKIFVRKRLEIYSETTNVLLIQFRKSSFHSSMFWGILTDNEKFFFYDTDDLGETELTAFKKTFDPITVETIIFYCNQNEPEDAGVISMAAGTYLQNLTLIKDYLDNKGGINQAKVKSAAFFLEHITGIKFKSNENSTGKYYLTQDDYTKWLNWFKKNNTKLYLDDREKKVKVR